MSKSAVRQVLRDALSGSERILLVEDEAAVRAVARRILQRYGYSVVEAANGEAALDMIAAAHERIDLIVSDVAMPGLGGRELVAAARVEGFDGAIILCSGYTENALERERKLPPGVFFIQKPFTPLSLMTTVRSALAELPRRSARR